MFLLLTGTFAFFTFNGVVMASSKVTTADFFPDVAKNLTAITWAHAVNDYAYLQNVLQSDIMMIEADIVMGTLKGDTSGNRLPVMGHPPEEISDISLEEFLSRISAHNDGNEGTKKGVKLDFKSIEVFEDSLAILNIMYNTATYPIWLNADILPGPVNSQVVPVDDSRFLTAAAKYPTTVLSIGWTTLYGGDINDGVYTNTHIDNMLSSIQTNNVKNVVTFPVRAGIAANSIANIVRLLDGVPQLEPTITIWSSDGDYVDIAKLRELIFTIGLERVYLDVPKEVSDQLNL